MASAGSPALRLPKPHRRPASASAVAERLFVAGLFVYTAIAIVQYPAMGVWSRTWGALSIGVGLSALWWAHLESAKFRQGWGLGAASLLLLWLTGPWLYGTPELRGWIGTLGCGLFVYAMVWIYAAHEREPGLQPLATAALMLSIGILAKPAVVAGCACLSLVVFIDQRRQVGGWWRSLLLLLTPVLLCGMLLGILNVLWAGGLVTKLWGANPSRSMGVRLWSLTGMSGESHVLWFPLGVLGSQLLESRTRKTALAYLFLVVFIGALGTASWMPHRLNADDVTLVVVAGACSLLALEPPRHWFCRLLALAGMAAAVFMEART
jgi:hypothetical protein